MTQWLRNLFTSPPEPLWVTKIARQLSDRDGHMTERPDDYDISVMLSSGVKVVWWRFPCETASLCVVGKTGTVELKAWDRGYYTLYRHLKSWRRKYLGDLATEAAWQRSNLAKLLVSEIETQ